VGGSPTIGSLFTERIVVGVGDMAVSNRSNVTLSTYALGSCIGIAAYDFEKSVGGLLHIMLPTSELSPEKALAQPSMFADTGLRELFKAIAGLKASKATLRIVLLGGAAVLSQSDMFKIGERNIESVTEILTQAHMKPVAQELGGFNNRTVHLNIGKGTVEMKSALGTKLFNLK